MTNSRIIDLKDTIDLSLNISRKLDIVVAIPSVTRMMYEALIKKIPENETLSCIKGKRTVLLNYV